MRRKLILGSLIILIGMVFQSVNAEGTVEPIEEERVIEVAVVDPEGSIIKGSQIALFDLEEPENAISQWTLTDSPIDITDLEPNHSYFIRQMKTMNGFYYADDYVIGDDAVISMVNYPIELYVGIDDPFEYEETPQYTLQLLDFDEEVITDVIAENAGVSVEIDTSALQAGKDYVLHAKTDQYYPDHSFTISKYKPDEKLEEMIKFDLQSIELNVVDKLTRDAIPEVELQILDPNNYLVYEIETEQIDSDNDDDELPSLTVELIADTDYSIHVKSVPEFYILPDNIEVRVPDIQSDDADKCIDIELISFSALSIEVAGSDNQVINEAEYRIFTDQQCTVSAVDIEENDSIVHIVNGKAEVNLLAGTYYLKQTKTAEHYYEDDSAKEIVIDPSEENVKIIHLKLTRINVVINSKSADSDRSVQDAEMQLLDENGNILHEWSNNSIMFNDLFAGESYIIHVTGTPAGFFNSQDQTITVPHRASSDQPLSATVCFYPFSVSINVLDKNTGIISNGNRMLLYCDGEVLTEWLSDSGFQSSRLFAGKTYIVSQCRTADHYLPAEDLVFTIPSEPSGQINTVFTYNMYCTPYVSVYLQNEDVTGNLVRDIQYGIYTDSSCTKLAKTIDDQEALYISGISDPASLNLLNGRYYLKQIDLPKEYYRSNQIIPFIIDHSIGTSLTLKTVSKPVQYLFGLQDSIDGSQLAGGKLRLADNSGNTLVEWEPTGMPYSDVYLQRGMTYTLEQLVAPSGYLKSGAVTFQVPEYEPPTDREYISIDSIGFVSLGIILTRSDSITVPLGNGRYALYTDRNCTELLNTIDGSAAVAVTDWNGSIYWNLLNGTYYLKELNSPDHFYTDPEIYRITVNHKNGKASITRVTNVPITIYVSALVDSKQLSNAEIQVFDENDNLVEEWITTDSKHMMDTMKLAVGKTYRIHAKTAPEGYSIGNEDIFFTIPSYAPQEIPTVIMKFEKAEEPKKEPDIPATTEPEGLITPEEQINQVNRWTVPLIFAITSCIGFLLFLILKKKKDENDEE